MPKHQPDRDDSQGGLGAGGPQDGPIGTGTKQGGTDESDGEGGQRHEGGSSRDSQDQG
jgi:hypothetical protein